MPKRTHSKCRPLAVMDSERDRAGIISLHLAGHRPCEIMRTLNWTRKRQRFISRTIQRYKETHKLSDRPKSGRPRGARTPQLRKRIRQLIQRNPRRSARKVARVVGISHTSMSRLLRQDLHLRPYKPPAAQFLSPQIRATRLRRCRALSRRLTFAEIQRVLFSDEKIFEVEEKLSPQNNRVYAARLTDLPDSTRLRKRKQHPDSLMVWAGVSSAGTTALRFIPRGQSLTAQYYRDHILQAVLKADGRRLFPRGKWTFQQDGAPAHTAKTVQLWCRDNLPDFISKDEWPPSSPDLNPMDYCVWPKLQSMVGGRDYRSMEALKSALRRAWQKFPLETARNSVKNWRGRLQACIQQQGGYER